jgi:hypothetical protein
MELSMNNLRRINSGSIGNRKAVGLEGLAVLAMAIGMLFVSTLALEFAAPLALRPARLVFDGVTVSYSQLAESDFLGTYKVTYPFGAETMTLKPGGAYTQVVSIKGRTTIRHSGRWSYDISSNTVLLEHGLEVAIEHADEQGELNPAFNIPVNNDLYCEVVGVFPTIRLYAGFNYFDFTDFIKVK